VILLQIYEKISKLPRKKGTKSEKTYRSSQNHAEYPKNLQRCDFLAKVIKKRKKKKKSEEGFLFF